MHSLRLLLDDHHLLHVASTTYNCLKHICARREASSFDVEGVRSSSEHVVSDSRYNSSRCINEGHSHCCSSRECDRYISTACYWVWRYTADDHAICEDIFVYANNRRYGYSSCV